MPEARERLVEQIVDHLRLLGSEADRLGTAASSSLRINRTDLRALQALRGSGGMTAGELAKALLVTSGATTRVIDGLVANGYIRRLPDPLDRRRVVVRMTSEAEAAVEAALDPLQQQVRDLLEGYRESDLETVSAFLTDIRSLIRSHTTRLSRRP